MNAPAPLPAAPAAATPPPAAIPAAERVPLPEKLAYGAGGLGGGIQNSIEQYLLTPVFVYELGVSPALVSLRNVVERIWDAVTDAGMGWLTDRTRTRWGRRKPYILVGGVLASLLLPALFLFDRGWGLGAIVAWMFLISLLISLSTTVWNIPYQCMLMEITPNSTERTNVAAWRGYVGFAGGLMMSWVWYLTQLPIFHGPDGAPDVIHGARWVVAGFALFALILALLPLWVKTRVTPADPAARPPVSLRANLRLTFASRPFVRLILFTLLMTMGYKVNETLDGYARFYHVFGGDQKAAAALSGVGGTLNMIAGLLGILLFQRLTRHKGKRFGLMALMGVVLAASLSTLFCYQPSLPYLSLLPGLLLSPATTAVWVLIPSMTGDVINDDELRHGARREGSFTSTFSWFLKLAQTLGLALSGPLLVWVGIQPELSVQSEDVLAMLRILLAVLPALLIGAAMVVLSRYPLTTERIAETESALAARRRALEAGA